MSAAIGIFLAVGLAWFVVMYACLGAPDHEIQFYRDQEITCFWDNMDGDAWCVGPDGATVCKWDVSGVFETASAKSIPNGCWNQEDSK